MFSYGPVYKSGVYRMFLGVGVVLVCTYFLTINALLILKMRDIIFCRPNTYWGHFKEYFEGAKTFLTPKLSREMPFFCICLPFQNQP
jgi:hypothetical protein